MSATATVKIEKFLGLNIPSGGDTNLKIGEFSRCDNVRIIENYKARKREGYEEMFEQISNKNIQGMWYGSVGGSYHFLFAINGYIYKKYELSGSIYDTLITSYSNCDAIRTTALDTITVGDNSNATNSVILMDNNGNTLTEIATLDINAVDDVGKFSFGLDKKIRIIVTEGQYADISAARTGLGTYTAYYRIGTLTDAPTTFFTFGGKLYILNGSEYYSWSGSGAIATVSGYRPILRKGVSPAGSGGEEFELPNLLNGTYSMWFNGDGATAIYQLPETSITSVDAVRVGGVTKTVTTHYTVNLTNGTVTFTVGNIPATGENNVEIDWTKGSGERSVVTGNKYFNFFEESVFLYGDGTNEVVYSELADGVASAEYFTEDTILIIGNNDYPVTYVANQHKRQMIFTTNDAYYSYLDTNTELGTFFSLASLNAKKGNKPLGQGQICINNPFTFIDGVYAWETSYVEDERNAKYQSERVQVELDEIDLSNVITCDYEKEGELWIASGVNVWIYNYRNDVWYKFILAHTPTCFLEVDRELYFGTTGGQIMKFNKDVLTDNGTKIADLIETGDIPFGENWKRKFLNFAYIGLQPQGRSRAKIGWISDYATSSDDETIEYNNLDFGNIDFGDFSFDTNYSPQPFRIKTKAKKFTYLKLVITCDSTTHEMTLLSITMPAIVGGVSK